MPKLINLGDRNGNFVCWGWETADIINSDYIVNFHDISLPFKNETCSAMYSSAMIEHISDESAGKLFSEIHRCLGKNGSFRVVCPDLDKVINAYKVKDHFYFLSNAVWLFEFIKEKKIPKESFLLHNNVIRILAPYIDTGAGPIADFKTFEEKFYELDKYEFAKWCVTLLEKDGINRRTNIGHINAYDVTKLTKMLKNAGFSKVTTLFATQYKNEIFDKKEFYNIEKRLEWLCLFIEAQK